MNDLDQQIQEVEEKLAKLRELYVHPPEGRSRISLQLQARPLQTLRDILLRKRDREKRQNPPQEKLI